MGDLAGLTRKLGQTSERIRKVAPLGKKILVVTHVDADGLASGSIAFAALSRMHANVALRSLPDLDRKEVRELAREGYDFYVVTDLGASLIAELEAALGGSFVVLDHHQLPPESLDNPNVVNAWQYGFDGGTEACSSTMAYLLARELDPDNKDLSYLAVVGAVADRQDGGEGRSLTGLNRLAMEDSQAAGLLSVAQDLLFTGRETRPIHESVALTSTPYLPGVSGSKDAVLAALVQSQVRVKADGRWRTVSELSTDEKKKVMEVIASMVMQGGSGSEGFSGLVGDVYTFNFEDPFTPLRDAREFATFLNACGRMGEAGHGMAICLGDRGEGLKSGMRILADYRSSISKALQGLSAEGRRSVQRGSLVVVRGEGIVEDRLLGPVTSILTSSPEFKGSVVVAGTTSGDSEYKISSRVGDSYGGTVNLGQLMREAAEAVGGVGGGHNMAAGAKIPAAEAEAFFRFVMEKAPA